LSQDDKTGLGSGKYLVLKKDFYGWAQKRTDSFVLSPCKDDQYGSASRSALLTYAKRIKRTNPTLAADITRWVRRIQYDIQGEHRAQQRTEKARST
jgi:hypothetical protein